jgi:hypothetical protein
MSLEELIAIARNTVDELLDDVEEKTGFRPDICLTCEYLTLHCAESSVHVNTMRIKS